MVLSPPEIPVTKYYSSCMAELKACLLVAPRICGSNFGIAKNLNCFLLKGSEKMFSWLIEYSIVVSKHVVK
jgi:hypothetical protein